MAQADPSPLGRGIKEIVDEMKNRNQNPAWIKQDDYKLGEKMQIEPQLHSLNDAIKEVERLKQTNLILEAKCKELTTSEDTVRAANRKLTESNETLQAQLRKISEREIEARTRAEVNEDMVEKLFDKMISRLH